MSFLNPGAFWLVLLIPPVVLLYLLKLRRDERLVSSTYLWQKMVRDMQANAPWQRLQRNLLLLLQILFLVALILSIARPFIWTRGINSQTTILILDASASMAAMDVSPSRFEMAKSEANQIVDKLPGEARVTVILAGDKPRTLVSLSSDRKLVRQAIEQSHVSTGSSDLGTALQIASAIAARQTDSQTVVLSDGNVTLPDNPSLPGGFTWVRIGERAENQAIELLTLQTNPADRTLTAFAQIVNYSPEPITRRVGIYADGAPVSVSDIALPPMGEQPVIASEILTDTQIIEARLLPSNTANDYLTLDDQAFAVVHPSSQAKVSLVSTGNRFLETALSLMPDVALDLKGPNDPIDPASNLIIYDGIAPQGQVSSQANLFFIAPPQSTEFFTVTGKINLPVPAIAEPMDAMLEHIDLSGVSIMDASQINNPLWAKALIVDAASPQPRPALLLTGENGGRRVAVLAFNLSHSDLPLQVAFPVLFSNLMNWLAPGAAGQIPSAIPPGTPLALSRWVQSGETTNSMATITRPDQSHLQLDLSGGNQVFADTGQLGVYEVALPDGQKTRFAVNLFSPAESNIEPRQTPLVAGLIAENGRPLTQSARQEWWRLLAEIALIFLTIEWLVYHRVALLQILRRLPGIRSNV